ncbi:MAG: hypothetical protein Q8O15_11095 [Rectinemataceae bacterium]|nr:hypothetical protein [Rectinemataceae bacterium]
MDLKLKGKVAVVTGAARGIGRAIALAFAAAEARSRGVRAIAARTDVTRSDEIKAMVARTPLKRKGQEHSGRSPTRQCSSLRRPAPIRSARRSS